MKVFSLFVALATLLAASALQLSTAPPRPVQATGPAARSSPPTMKVLTSFDGLDNDLIPSDDTLTPARGCKGCFG